MSSLTQLIKNKATELGFDLIGFTPAQTHKDISLFNSWLAKGYGASMEWLKRGEEKRGNPELVLPNVKSIICCGVNYYRGHPKSIDSVEVGKGWISNYAWGEDYHDVVLEKLKHLEDFIRLQYPSAQMKSYVDTGPILERSYASSAGLGWIGKNTLLINQKIGSYFFIGEILIDVELEYDDETPDHCGKCNKCMEACPTQALTPYELDANKCISYLTIEHRGAIKEELAEKMGHHLVGCDICQDVCPWNRRPPVSKESKFDPRAGNFHPILSELESLTPSDFSMRFKGSPIKRLKYEGLKRNLENIRK